MRYLPWLVLAISLALASTVEARLFWQTFGSTSPTADGGSSWNSNQDYFVPRHPSSGGYGLFSSCKSGSMGPSAASMYSHPMYPGYSGIYGPLHYNLRNHVYAAYCGSSSIQSTGNGSCAGFGNVCSVYEEPVAPLHNVEPAGLEILGSIPIESNGLLSQADLSQLGNLGSGGEQMLLQPQQNPLELLQGLPGLSLPQFPQP